MVCSTEKPVQPFIVLRRSWVRFEVLNNEREDIFVGHAKSARYTVKASITRSGERSFNLVQGLPSSLVAALRALSKDFLEDIAHAVLSLKQYTMAAKTE